MTLSPSWNRAAVVVAGDGPRVPEVLALPARLPTLDELYTFMRDAELRFTSLKLRIEERSQTSRGDQLVIHEIALRHPGHARVITSDPGRGIAGSYELWISDGETIRTWSAVHRLGTNRPVRNRPRGLADRDFPGMSRVYEPLTALPMETLADTFVHPAGYCQNVLATGRTWVSGTDEVAGREAVVLECDHPRTIEMAADRLDFHVRLWVDRRDGIILRLIESIGAEVTRDARVVACDPDADLPASTFDFEFPAGAATLY